MNVYVNGNYEFKIMKYPVENLLLSGKRAVGPENVHRRQYRQKEEKEILQEKVDVCRENQISMIKFLTKF